MTTMTTTPIHLDPKQRETPETTWLNRPIAVLPSDTNGEVFGVLRMLHTADDPRDGLCVDLELFDGGWRTFVYAGPTKNIAYLRGPRSDKWIARNGQSASGATRERRPRTGKTLNMASVPEAQIDEIYAMADAALAAAMQQASGLASPLSADDIAAVFATASAEAEDEDATPEATMTPLDLDALAVFDAKLVAEYGIGPEPEAEAEPVVEAEPAEDEQSAAIAALVAEADAEADAEEVRVIDPDAYQADPDELNENRLSPEQEAEAAAALMSYAASEMKRPRRKSTGPRSGTKRGK